MTIWPGYNSSNDNNCLWTSKRKTENDYDDDHDFYHQIQFELLSSLSKLTTYLQDNNHHHQ